MAASDGGRRLLRLGGGLLIVLALAAGILAVPSVQDAIFTHFVERRLRTGAKALFADDDLKVLLCGTSAPFAVPDRAQSCVAIIAGGKYYLVDTGPGSGRNLQLWQLPGSRLGAVFLTHFHSDHIGDLGEINVNAWLAGHPGSLPVYGGPGVDRVVAGFNDAYSLDHGYRTANSGAALLPPGSAVMQPVTIAMIGASTAEKARRSLPMQFGELRVTAFEVNHDPAEPAFGYRFDFRGRSVVVSGDTNYHPPLAAAAEGTDVLIHEAQSQHLVQLIAQAADSTGQSRIAHLMRDIQGYHTAPVDVARIANQAHARLLVFTHLNPPVSNPLVSSIFYRGVRAVRNGGWISGEDGTLIDLPAGSTQIKVSRLRP